MLLFQQLLNAAQKLPKKNVLFAFIPIYNVENYMNRNQEVVQLKII